MPKALISVDVNKSPETQPQPLHNRWHPDIPALVSVKPGETFRVETIDWTGEQAYMILSTAPVEGRLSGVLERIIADADFL